MVMDVIYVTYNSEKWIVPCFESWRNNIGNNEINIIVVDNASTDNTVELLERMKQEMAMCFAGFQIIQLCENKGFGTANNIGFQQGTADFVCFFNIDTELLDTTLFHLGDSITKAKSNIGVWELRQIPYEHPKVYDPVTQETDWCSGAAFAVRRSVYAEVGGFDECFFMYAEDVDLSWRIRQHGYHILYCPKALICHKTYMSKGEVKFMQYAYGMRNNLLMRYRYGNLTDIAQGYLLFFKLLLRNKMGKDFNKRFVAVISSHWKWVPYFRKSKAGKKIETNFYGLDYARTRRGAFYQYSTPAVQARIIVFVLDSGKDDPKETIQCIMQQTYPVSEVKCIGCSEDIGKELRNKNVADDTWLSVIEGQVKIYADHFETLVGAIVENCEVVGSVDDSGSLPEDMSYYMFRYGFYNKNWDQGFEQLCRKKAFCVEKQTVSSQII